MEDDRAAGTVAADFKAPDDTTRRAVGRDGRDDSRIAERVGGVGAGDVGDRSVGYGELAQRVANDGDVEIAVPESGLTEDAATDRGGVEALREEFLNNVVGTAVEVAETGLVKEIEATGFAGSDSEMRMRSGSDGIGKNENAARAEIDVVGAKSVLIGRSEEVKNGAGGRELNDGITEVDGAVEVAVGGFDPDVAGGIQSRAGASAPESAFGVGAEIGGSPDEGLGESGFVVAHEPAVIGVVVAVRAERDVDGGTAEKKSRTLHVSEDVEAGGGDINRATEDFRASGEVKGVEAVVVVGTGVFGFGADIEGIGRRIDDGSGSDTDFRNKVAGFASVGGGYGGFASFEHGSFPKQLAGRRIGVEGVDEIAFCSDKDDVMFF